MRKLIVTMYLSVDGVMEAPQEWHDPGFSKDVEDYKVTELLKNSGPLLLGERTYREFFEAWPQIKDDLGYADRINSIKKYVVSNNLKEAPWSNSEIISGDVYKAIKKLKQEDGKDIFIHGSAALVNSLIPHGLIDEFRLMIFPVVVGKGKRLFTEGTNVELELIGTKMFSSGVVLLSYKPAKS